MRNSLAQPIWLGRLKEERGTTIQSSIHNAMLTEIDSETSHNQSVRNSVGSSTRGSKSTALQHRTP
jgi:hypothetical protein